MTTKNQTAVSFYEEKIALSFKWRSRFELRKGNKETNGRAERLSKARLCRVEIRMQVAALRALRTQGV